MATKKAVKKEAPAVTPNEAQDPRETTMIPVEKILFDKNIRFGLKKGRVESLAEAIINDGGVMQAIEVYPLNDEEVSENEGKEFRAVFGHYRGAAVTLANSQGHSFEMPCVIVERAEPLTVFKRQLSENLDREDLSPIDKAVAMKEAFETHKMSRMEVRNLFPTYRSKKGNKVEPASNSHVNMTLSFLTLSKKIQTLIHEGDIGPADAYWLTKQPEEKREAAVETAIANRQKYLATEEADENKFLEEEKKREEADAKAKEAGVALETAEKEVETAISDAKAKADTALKLYQEKMTAKADDKKKAEEAHKAAEKEAADAQKALVKKQADLAKKKEKADKDKADAQERAKKLQDARANAQKAGGSKKSTEPLKVKASAATEVKNAPNEDGIPITHTAIKKVISDLCLSGPCPKVQAIGKALNECFNGRIKDNELFRRLAVITGEKAEKEENKKAKK